MAQMLAEDLLRHCRKWLKYIDGKLFWKKSKGKAVAGNEAGCRMSHGYRIIGICGEVYLTHRIVYLLHRGCLPEYVDHINQDHTDNRIENLRACTKAQNCQNQRVHSDNVSGFSGVHWVKNRNKWAAYISAQGKRINLGFGHATKEEAISARLQGELKYHGEFGSQINPTDLSEIDL